MQMFVVKDALERTVVRAKYKAQDDDDRNGGLEHS